jgi:His/Glu/Gln/Arg/opine family amino acid ABC transporter permease subunit
MATAAAEARRAPPEARGDTGPFPLGVLGLGIVSLGAVLLGTIVVQVGYALWGGGATEFCRAEGLVPGELRGALGVCHIVEGVKSAPQTILQLLAIVTGVAAMALGFGTYKSMPTKRMREHAITGAVLGVQGVALAGFLLWFRGGKLVVFARQFLNIEVLEGSLDAFLTGAKNTLVLAAAGEFGGIVIGLALALLALSSRRVVRAPARTYINFFRGTPLIWQLSFFHFGISLGLGLNLGAFNVAMLVFALNTGAYASEVFRAGIQSIERGQMEAARSLGMSYLQAMRFAIVPQAVRRVIPPLMNEFVILIKDTALITVLGLAFSEYDILTTAREGYAETFNATFLVAAAFAYLVVTLPLIRIVSLVEQRLRSGLTGIVGQ